MKSDVDLAAELGVSPLTVGRYRRARGIEPLRSRAVMVSDGDLLWLAGLLEGEGAFMLTKSGGYRYARIAVGMVDRDVIERVGTMWMSKVQVIQPPRQFPTRQVNYRVFISGIKAVRLMEILRPHMGMRRQGQIDAVLAYEDGRPDANAQRREWSRAAMARRKKASAA